MLDCKFGRQLCVLVGCVAFLAGNAAAEDSWGKNLLKNASFADGDQTPTGWTVRIGAQQPGEAVFSKISLDTTVVRNRGRSLLLEGDDKTTRWYALESPPIDVSPGRRYRFSGWIETEGVTCVTNQFANCNLYVMFADADNAVVLVGRNQVAATEQTFGTQTWKKLTTIVPAPVGAVTARLGIVLTCSGKAWFDDVTFQAYGDIEWTTKKTNRFVFYHEPNDPPSAEAVQDLEMHLTLLELRLELKFPRKIRYYKYSSRERKVEITGKPGSAHFESDGVHALHYRDRHEIIHVLMEQMGNSLPFFAEGIAVYLAGPWNNKNIHANAVELANEGRLVSIQSLLERRGFLSQPMEATYPQAGSFVGFLIERFGIEKFKKFYPLSEPYETYWDTISRFKSVYGETVEELEDRWLDAMPK